MKIENRYKGEMSSFEREYSTENCNLIKNKANNIIANNEIKKVYFGFSDYKTPLLSSLHAHLSYFPCCSVNREKVPFLQEKKRRGIDICT